MSPGGISMLCIPGSSVPRAGLAAIFSLPSTVLLKRKTGKYSFLRLVISAVASMSFGQAGPAVQRLKMARDASSVMENGSM